MKNLKIQQYGFWDSSISADSVASSSDSYSQLKWHDNFLYWLEQRATEKGRRTVVCYDGKNSVDCLPANFSARTRVHEYGGGDYAVADSGIYFVNDADQAIYCIQNEKINRLTDNENSVRFADLQISPDNKFLVCVREQHVENAVINDLIALDLATNTISILTHGADFYMSPVFSKNGAQLAWVQWNLPQMPWDGTELYCAEFCAGKLNKAIKIAGSVTESIYQPSFDNENKLYYVSDKSGWWNIYCEDKDCASMQAECGYPAWIFGTNTYALLDDKTLIAIATTAARQKLVLIRDGKCVSLETTLDSMQPYIVAGEDQIYFIGANAQRAGCIYRYEIKNNKLSLVAGNAAQTVNFSQPQSIEFPTSDNDVAHAFYYAPCNANFAAPSDTKPPLIVMSHGGPTSSTSTALDYKIQFWTSRGFAVIDVNYRGSTGYGKVYRDKLNKNWGKSDVEDCIFAAKYCVKNNLCDANKIFVRGKSASGLTTLLCLEQSDLFAGGAVYYGVADLMALLADTHKFESRYLDLLIGPYPAAKNIYAQRSAINHIDKIKSPLIVFQGLQDKVVPPAQSEVIVEALKLKNISVDYITFANEGHGFRDAANIKTALNKELEFYRYTLFVKEGRE